MQGVIQKKHFCQIVKVFGIKIALKILFSRKKTALEILMEVN